MADGGRTAVGPRTLRPDRPAQLPHQPMKGTLKMTSEFFRTSDDCADAAVVAQFWGAVLGRRVADGATSEDAVLLVEPAALSGPRLAFHRVPETKVAKKLRDV